MAGVDYFVEHAKMSHYFWERVMVYDSAALCWYSWLVLALWPLLAVSGILVQWKFTAKGIDHDISKLEHVCMVEL